MVNFFKDNISTTERFTRGFLGMVLLEVVLLVTALSSTAIAILSVIALYLVLTAIMAWDPLNLIARPKTKTASKLSTRGAHALKA